MSQNRISQRHRTLKEGKVVLTHWSVIDCRVRDLSEAGARLEFSGPTALPKDFRLCLVSSNLLVPVELAWQRPQSAGVRFTGPGEVGALSRA